MQRKIFVLCLLIFAANSAVASVLPETMKASLGHDYGMPSMFNLVFSMFFVIGLIYLTGWVYQKLNLVNKKQVSKLVKDSKNTRFTVLQSMSLGQQRHIYTIEMNGKVLLVGSTPTQINLIKEFDNIDEAQSIDAISGSINVSDDNIKKSVTSDIDEIYKKYKN